MNDNTILTRIYHSPCGDLILGSYNGMLCLCNWVNELHPGRVERRLKKMTGAVFGEGTDIITEKAFRELDEYFRKERKTFDIPLLPIGSDFQKAVWDILSEIPFGKTVSYRDVALHAGKPEAVRAIANAVGANPLSIFIPCHRVIGSDSAITGYGGGIQAKMNLLKIEEAL